MQKLPLEHLQLNIENIIIYAPYQKFITLFHDVFTICQMKINCKADIRDWILDLHLSTLINLTSLDVRSEIDGVPGIISSVTATVGCLVTAKRHAKGRQGERQRKD